MTASVDIYAEGAHKVCSSIGGDFVLGFLFVRRRLCACARAASCTHQLAAAERASERSAGAATTRGARQRPAKKGHRSLRW